VAAKGSTHGGFRRALDHGSTLAALSAAAELHHVGLVDALDLLLLLARMVRRKSLILLALLVASWAGNSLSAAAGVPVRDFEQTGIAFQYPAHWFTTTKPLSTGVEPIYRFAVANFPVRRTPLDSGPCLAGIAKQRPADGVLAFIREARGADLRLDRFPARPTKIALPKRWDNAGCLGAGSRQYSFRDSGLECPRFDGQLSAGLSGPAERLSGHAKEAEVPKAVSAGVSA
jgi:hypothetical protein